MKIKCVCGNVIPDQSDYLTYKGRFVADQDYFDLCDAIEGQIEALATDITRSPSDITTEAATQQAIRNANDAIYKYTGRTIYQCPTCGRLFVDDAQSRSQVFSPAAESVPKNLMRSIEGDKWKRPLRGMWDEWQDRFGKGSLWWGFGGGEEGYERHDDWEDLKRRYFEVFAELQAKDILRDAFLRRGDEYLHKWP